MWVSTLLAIKGFSRQDIERECKRAGAIVISPDSGLTEIDVLIRPYHEKKFSGTPPQKLDIETKVAKIIIFFFLKWPLTPPIFSNRLEKTFLRLFTHLEWPNRIENFDPSTYFWTDYPLRISKISKKVLLWVFLYNFFLKNWDMLFWEATKANRWVTCF